MIHTVQHIEAVARLLRPLGETFVFLGGAVVPLLVDRPETLKIRPTKDVDVIYAGGSSSCGSRARLTARAGLYRDRTSPTPRRPVARFEKGQTSVGLFLDPGVLFFGFFAKNAWRAKPSNDFKVLVRRRGGKEGDT